MLRSHIFPHYVLATVTLQEVGLEVEGLEPDPGVSHGFPSAHQPIPPSWEYILSYWCKRLEGWLWVHSVCSKSGISWLPWLKHSHPEGKSPGARGAGLDAQLYQDVGFGRPALVSMLDHSRYAVSVGASDGWPHPFQICFQTWAGSVHNNRAFLLAVAVLTPVSRSKWRQERACQGDLCKLDRVLCSFRLLSVPCLRSEQVCECFSWVESRFLVTLRLVPLVFRSGMGTHLFSAGPDSWGSAIQ